MLAKKKKARANLISSFSVNITSLGNLICSNCVLVSLHLVDMPLVNNHNRSLKHKNGGRATGKHCLSVTVNQLQKELSFVVPAAQGDTAADSL